MIEHIDIGGPALVRAAAKNFGDVAVISNIADYSYLSKELKPLLKDLEKKLKDDF